MGRAKGMLRMESTALQSSTQKGKLKRLLKGKSAAGARARAVANTALRYVRVHELMQWLNERKWYSLT